LLDSIEDEVKQGGCVVDWHACDLFPKSWIDLVVVLRTDSTRLYDRLALRCVVVLSDWLWLTNNIRRGYAESKLQENLDSEIMQVLLEEAREAYDEEIVVELQSDTPDDIEGNVERIERWVASWKENNARTKGGS
jgi:adenylate kinase